MAPEQPLQIHNSQNHKIDCAVWFTNGYPWQHPAFIRFLHADIGSSSMQANGNALARLLYETSSQISNSSNSVQDVYNPVKGQHD